MPTIPQRIGSAFAVLCGRYGEVTKMAEDREQSRQSLYREAEKVVEAIDGTAAQAQIEELELRLAQSQAEVQALEARLKHAVEITPVWRQLDFPVVLPQPRMLPVDRQAERGPRPPLRHSVSGLC